MTRVLIGAIALTGGAAIPAVALAGGHAGGNGHGRGHGNGNGNTVTTVTTTSSGTTTPTVPKRDHGLCNAAAHGNKRGWRHSPNGAPRAFADLVQGGEALEAAATTTTTTTATTTSGTTTTDTTTTTQTTTTDTSTTTTETDEGTSSDARADIAAACASLEVTVNASQHGHKGHHH